MVKFHVFYWPCDDNDDEDDDKVEDNDKDDDNYKDDNVDKGISALGLDRILGFSRGHQGHQPHDEKEEDDTLVEDNDKEDNNNKDDNDDILLLQI